MDELIKMLKKAFGDKVKIITQDEDGDMVEVTEESIKEKEAVAAMHAFMDDFVERTNNFLQANAVEAPLEMLADESIPRTLADDTRSRQAVILAALSALFAKTCVGVAKDEDTKTIDAIEAHCLAAKAARGLESVMMGELKRQRQNGYSIILTGGEPEKKKKAKTPPPEAQPMGFGSHGA